MALMSRLCRCTPPAPRLAPLLTRTLKHTLLASLVQAPQVPQTAPNSILTIVQNNDSQQVQRTLSMRRRRMIVCWLSSCPLLSRRASRSHCVSSVKCTPTTQCWKVATCQDNHMPCFITHSLVPCTTIMSGVYTDHTLDGKPTTYITQCQQVRNQQAASSTNQLILSPSLSHATPLHRLASSALHPAWTAWLPRPTTRPPSSLTRPTTT